jgi:hypothetical protein
LIFFPHPKHEINLRFTDRRKKKLKIKIHRELVVHGRVGTKDGIQLMEQAKSMIRHNLLHDPALLAHPFFSSPGSPPPPPPPTTTTTTTSAATKILKGKTKTIHLGTRRSMSWPPPHGKTAATTAAAAATSKEIDTCVCMEMAHSPPSRGDVALSFFVFLSFFLSLAIRDCVVATPITTKP